MTHRTAPQDRISFPHKVVYGIGGFVNNLLAQGIGNMMAVLTLALGMDFRAVGLLGSLPRFLRRADRSARRLRFGQDGEPAGLVVGLGESLKGIVTVEAIDDVEDEVVILPLTLFTGAWASVDMPLGDFEGLSTREHLAQILISGDLTEVYVDNVYLYRSDDTTRAEP